EPATCRAALSCAIGRRTVRGASAASGRVFSGSVCICPPSEDPRRTGGSAGDLGQRLGDQCLGRLQPVACACPHIVEGLEVLAHCGKCCLNCRLVTYPEPAQSLFCLFRPLGRSCHTAEGNAHVGNPI